jgi:alpha-tubulin suppressor-like RCC1 family protein
MSYSGIGLNHQLEVDGQVFVSNIESGSTIPFEIYSDYSNKGALTESRQLRLRVNPSEIPNSTSHIDMGIDNQNGEYFYISQPVFDSTISGNKHLFNIDNTGQVNILTPNIICGSLTTSNVTTQNINNLMDKINISNDFGLKAGSVIEIDYTNTVPREIITISKTSVAAASFYSYTSIMVLSTGGKLYSAGYNNYGQLGLGDTINRRTLTPVVGEGSSGVVDVKSGAWHHIILKQNNALYSCGYNGYGQLGLGNYDYPSKFTIMTGDGSSGVVDFSTSFYSTIFVKNTGAAYGCGLNSQGMLGGSSGTTPALIPGEGSSGVTKCSVGNTHSMLLKSDAVYISGDNIFGQCGQGYSGGSLTTFTLANGEGSSGVTKIAAGDQFSVILKNDGAVYGCGYDSNGQLGRGTTYPYPTVFTTAVGEGAANVTDIVTTFMARHVLIKKSNGKIYGTGLNSFGQLGLGDTSNRLTFTEIPSTEGATNISVGSNLSSIVLDSNVYVTGKIDINNISPYKTTFTQLDYPVSDNVVFNINNTISSNTVIKHALEDDNENNGAVYGLYRTPTNDDVMRIGVFTTNPTNYITINENSTVSASGYSQFTGFHSGVTKKSIEKNLIVSVDNTIPLAIFSTSDVLTGVSISDIENDPNVFGVSDGDEHYNALGDGTVWVSDANGTLNAGDYITSSTLSGYGVRQEGSRKMNYTVAKILQNCDFTNAKRFLSMSEDKTLSTITKEEYLSNTGNVYRAEVVACTYHCG